MTLDWRYELKLRCAGYYLDQARTWLRLHPAGLVVAYPPRRVNSLYFDTPDLGSFDDNLEGVSPRNKLRWRWYGDTLEHIRPHLELKHKEGMLGYKQHAALSGPLDLTRPWAELLPAVCSQLSGEWRDLCHTLSRPTLLNYYQREYFVTYDRAVRVTLDYAQVAYDQRHGVRPNLHARLPLEDLLIIEVKADPLQVQRVREVISRFPLPRSRNSKYANGVLAAW
jgi:hypothetical protein